MHQTLTNISQQLKALIAQIQAVIPSDLARLSNAVDRHLRDLVSTGVLEKLA
jgi:hypothetical protein